MDQLYISLIRKIVTLVILLLSVVSALLLYSIFYINNLQIHLGKLKFQINENYYSGLVTIVVSLFALALPLAVNAITANQDKRFSNNEMGESFYKNAEYIFMKRAVWPLIIVTAVSYIKETSPMLDLIVFVILVYVLFRFVKFMKVVEGYVANFPNILIQEEKFKIRKILGR
jgi:hypothetical protein